MNGIMEATQRAARAIVKCLHPRGFDIFSNNGAIAGRSVFHFLWHWTPHHQDISIHLEPKLNQNSDGKIAFYGRPIREFINRTA
jgi:diadenosine tetraphosphate (Ap4A) HIT family hydrolase